MDGFTAASLDTTTDGAVWTKASDSLAVLFDNAVVSNVATSADGLFAVGASLGREFVATARAWASADGLT